MCGIVGYTGTAAALPILINGLYALEYRGYDSAGIAAFADDGLHVLKSRGRIAELENRIQQQGRIVSHCGIAHTRWATHGEPSDVNSHPHIGGKHGEIAVVHNGIIENYLELRNWLEKKGYAFSSETDTETVAHLIAYHYEHDEKDLVLAVRAALPKIRGSYAFCVVSEDNPGLIVAVRKDNPLVIGLGDGENIIASDVTAIVGRTKRYVVMEDHEIALVRPDSICIQDKFGDPAAKTEQTITWDLSAAEKGGYEHFMFKEIMEQPRAVADTIHPRISNGRIMFEENGLTQEKLSRVNHVHIVACGSALHAGMVGQHVIESLCRVRCTAKIASEFRYEDPIIEANDLCIVISQSGETADTLAALRLAKTCGAFTVAVVNVVSSGIAREADSVLYTWAGPEIAVATTKAYSSQLAALYLFAGSLSRAKNVMTEEEERLFVQELENLPQKLSETLELRTQMQFIANQYQNRSSIFFIGRGLDHAAAMEASLKLKEISYIHSEAYAGGELKHGTISLIENGTLVVALATQPKLYEKVISNVRETAARGAEVVLITGQDFRAEENLCAHLIRLPECIPMISASLSIVPLQMLAYYTAVERSCDVDKPRNLAKSVTVE